MNLLKKLHFYRRAIFYSGVISLGLIFLMNIESKYPKLYLLASVILYLVVLFEMFYIWFISKEKLRQLDLPLISSYSKIKQMIHHFLLPFLFYLSLVGFIYYNNQVSLHIPVIIFSFFAFISLFINLRAFYQDKIKLEEETYYVYDLIELIIFFCITNISLNMAEANNITQFFPVIINFVLSLFILILNLYQLDHLSIKPILLISILSFISSFICYVLIFHSSFNGISITTLLFLCYYFIFGILSHKIDGSLTTSIIFEYMSIFLLSLAFFLGIS
jgi:hypothetical protein